MLILFGVSFRTAPLAVRKTLMFNAEEAADLLERGRGELPGKTPALVLSTCNRTEFYLDAPSVGPWHDLLKRVRPGAPAAGAGCHYVERHGADAFRHLARVACGLESAILGDGQVLSQLRAAVTLAQRAGTLGGELNRATAAALRLGRAARSQTGIAEGSAGIGSAVASTITAESPSKRVAVLGAGEAARSVARHLTKRGIVDLTFCNRTAAEADRLASEHGGAVRPWAELAAVLEDVDAAAVATAAPVPVLDGRTLRAIAGRRRAAGRDPLLVVDAGFPPQVDKAGGAGVRVIPLDAIRPGEEIALSVRRAAVPAVEAMVDAAVAAWAQRSTEPSHSGT
ncbi:MAG TPA: hypothetical protein VHL53_07680 [Acidimicrobiia bacterium]|nr:hypothetical protein [Acidimicrobiia bacterium]